MEEFTNSIGWKIFYGAIAACIIGFCLFILTSGNSNESPGLVAYIIGIMMFLLLAAISKIIRKVMISADSIVSIRIFGRKEILTGNVKGVRISNKVIQIEAISPAGAKITINSHSELADSENLTKWLRENFTDLDADDLKQEQSKVLQDPTLGLTEKDREEKLSKAKQLAMGYNVVGAILAFAGFFFAYQSFVSLLLMVYPLLGIVIMKFSNGLIKLVSSKKRSVYNFIMLGFYLPVLIMFITSLLNYDIFSYHNFWPIAIGISVVVATLLAVTGINRSVSSVVGQVFFMIVLSALYGYGSTTQINCVFDQSKTQIYQATVLDRRMEKGKSTTYYLTLSAWGPSKQINEVTVGRQLYYEVTEGKTVRVNYKTGLLNIPWFTITD